MSRSRPRASNRDRGEVEFAGLIARPTLEAVVEIEEDLGPIVDVTHRLIGGPSYRDFLGVIRACVDREIYDDVGGAVLSIGTDRAIQCAVSLALSYFVRGDEAPAPDPDVDGPQSFPAKTFVAQAVAVWGQSPDEVWIWTVPEWWAVYDAFVLANGGDRDRDNALTDDDKRAIADRLRAAERELRQRARATNVEAIAE